MKSTTRYLALLTAMALLSHLTGCGGPTGTAPADDGPIINPGNDPGTMGEAAPDFSYTSLEGVEYTLSELSGKVVFIFFFGANCPHCINNGPRTETQIYQPFQNNPDFVALGLDTWNTSASAVESFKNVTGITYPLLLNAKEALIDYYGSASEYDRAVVVDGDGNIAYMGTNQVTEDEAGTVTDVINEELSKL